MNTRAPTNPAPVGAIKMSWFESSQKNKPQGNSVAGGLLLMLVSGLHISYGIFNSTARIKYDVSVLPGSWYVGVILGSVVATVFIDKWEKKIYYVSVFVKFYKKI